MAKAIPRDLTDPNDRWWTIDQAAEHLGVTRRTIERYIHDGLPLHFKLVGGYLDRDELLTEVRERAERRTATLGKKSSA